MNQPRRILIDLGKLKNRYSGLGEVSFNFGKTLSENTALLKKESFEVHLLVPKEYKFAFGKEVKYISLGFLRRHFPFLYRQYDLWYAVHQDSGYLPGNNKTRYLLTINDLNFIYKEDKSKVARRSKILQEKINRACYLTVISNFTKTEIQNHLSADDKQIEVIYPGVCDVSKITPEKPPGIDKYEKFFFHISTLQPKKNVMVLVDMMKLLPQKKLVIAGSWDSDYAKEILKRIENENILNIITLSKVSDGQKAWLLQNCEAVFFPSLQEGFGIPVIEAMYCGKPAFASTYTSLPEVGADKAFYWHNFEPEYMKNIVIEKMESIKNDKEFSNTLREYAGRFTWQKNVTRYIALFKELIG